MIRRQRETADDIVVHPLGSDAATDTFEAAALLHQSCFDDGWSAETLKDLCRVVGTIAVTAGSTNDAPFSSPIGLVIVRTVADQADLLTIGVAPDHRRRGLGAFLLRAAEAGARELGAEALFLEVAQDNAPAIAMYQDAGYIVSGMRRNYYRAENGRGTAVIMQKSLTI